MKIIIRISDPATRSDMLGIPMDDLKDHFLPQIGIAADSVVITTIDECDFEPGSKRTYITRHSKDSAPQRP